MNAPTNPASKQAILSRVAQAAEEISDLSDWAEAHGRLHERVNALLHDIGVPRLYLPEALGGYEQSPVVCAEVCEALADADSAAGWHVMVYNAARLMAAHWPEALVEHLWGNDPDTLVAASGHTPLKGERLANGNYRVTGRNSFVSGVHHADYVMSPMICEDEPHVAVVPVDHCTIIDNWDTLGMRGTGSNDIHIEGIEVPAHQVIAQAQMLKPNRYYHGRLYQCPSRVVFATYIPVALSMARRALDILSELAQNKVPYATDHKLKERKLAQLHYGQGLGIYRAARCYFYSSLEAVWDRAGRGDTFDDQAKAELYLCGTHTLQACAQVVRHVADAAGSSVQHKGSPLEKIVRDMETLRHHGFASESRFASVTQVFWGAELDYPLVLR